MYTNNNFELSHNSKFISHVLKRALWPCMLSIFSANINVIVDGILVGQKIGPNALAAINICMPVSLFLCVIGSFFSSGTAINSSKLQALSISSNSNEYYKADIILSYIASLIITILGVIFINPICQFLCSNLDIYPFVRSYVLITIIGSIFKIMLYIPFWYLRLDGKNKEISYMMALLTIGNIILDILLVYVINGGIFGAGLANVIATALSFGLGMYYLSKNDSSFYFDFKINRKIIKFNKIFLDGIPSSLNNLFSTIRILMINSILLYIGGVSLVAIFTAVMGIFSIGECIILGIPQAATAMLGVYIGEKDYDSCKIILKSEIKWGVLLSSIFLFVTIIFSPFIGKLYGLHDNMLIPLVFMCISIFPALLCNIMSGYYNISGNNLLSVSIIFIRLIVMTYLGLLISMKFNMPEFLFFIFAEILTLIYIYIVTGIYKTINNDTDRFLLYKLNSGAKNEVLNFSVENDNKKICDACEKISDFCNENGLNIKDTMKIQLAIEEALVLISQVNNNVGEIINGFDIRAFIKADIKGLRIRYDGLDFNPFEGQMNTSDYMGIKMISEMLETTIYKRTFGVNTLILLLKENTSNE